MILACGLAARDAGSVRAWSRGQEVALEAALEVARVIARKQKWLKQRGLKQRGLKQKGLKQKSRLLTSEGGLGTGVNDDMTMAGKG